MSGSVFPQHPPLGNRLPALVLTVLFASGALAAAPMLELADHGTTGAFVHVTADAGEPERNAARELRDYLRRATSAPFYITPDWDPVARPAAIHVGPTAARRVIGRSLPELGPEEWVIEVIDDQLLIYGGRPRGTLYAVYRFLEDELGVRWWNPYEEFVPRVDRLSVRAGRRQGQPAFGYRDIHGIDGPRTFCVRSRINGHFALLDRAWGGVEGYGPPSQVHNFRHYVPVDEFGETHPEYFSEVDGERIFRKTQLCLTNEDLLEEVFERMTGYIDQARREAREAGQDPPRLFDFSQNDWGNPCQCEECAQVRDAQGAESASLVEFVGALASRVGQRYPDVLIDTLAYYYSLDPPQRGRLPENVVVRLAALQRRNFIRPLRHEEHASIREAIAGWQRVTSHLRIWDYSVTFGPGRDLPLPNLGVLADDLRYYHEEGIEGLFIQHEGPIAGDMRDLKLWVLARLLEDPDRSLDRLVRDFTEGYYGAAGGTIRRYLRELERQARRRPARVGYPAQPEDYTWLDLKRMRRAHKLFDRAEAQVAGDEVLERRVRHARLSLDRATLVRSKALRDEWHDGVGIAIEVPIDVPAGVPAPASRVRRRPRSCTTHPRPPRARPWGSSLTAPSSGSRCPGVRRSGRRPGARSSARSSRAAPR